MAGSIGQRFPPACCATQTPAKINAPAADFKKKGISLILAPVDLLPIFAAGPFGYPSAVSKGGPPRVGGPLGRSTGVTHESRCAIDSGLVLATIAPQRPTAAFP